MNAATRSTCTCCAHPATHEVLRVDGTCTRWCDHHLADPANAPGTGDVVVDLTGTPSLDVIEHDRPGRQWSDTVIHEQHDDGTVSISRYDQQGLLNDHPDDPRQVGWSLWTGDLRHCLHARRYRHGVLRDLDDTRFADVAFHPYTRSPAMVAHYVDGVLTDRLLPGGRRMFARVYMDQAGSALSIESYVGGQFQCLIDPANLPGT